MAENNGQNNDSINNEWTPAQFRALRDVLKRPGIVVLKLWPEMPDLDVTLDMSGIGPLMLAGKIVNQVLAEREESVRKAAKEIDEDKAQTWYEISAAVLRQHDYILSAVIVKPKYYMLDQLPEGAQPEDGLCVYDFTAEMRWAIFNVLNEGADALSKFRIDPVGYATTLSESTAARATERADTSAGISLVDQDTIRPGDLVEGTEARGRTNKKSRKVAQIAAVD